MTKRDAVLLLLPSAFLIFIAVLALSVAPAFSFVPRIEQRRQQDFERFVAKIQSGEVQPTKEKWIHLLRGSREVGAEVATEIEAGHAALTRTLAAGIFVGVLIQMYVIFRVKAGLRKTAS